MLLTSLAALGSTAQKEKNPQQVFNDTSTILVPLRGIKSGGVRGCDNCNISGKLASSLGLESFTIKGLHKIKMNKKDLFLQVHYLISDLKGKIKAGGTTVSGPYGDANYKGVGSSCSRYGFTCVPSPNRIGKTKYEITTEGKNTFLVVTFLEDLRVEKGFFGG